MTNLITRSGIYILFILAMAIGWFMKRMKQAKSSGEADAVEVATAANSTPQPDHPRWEVRLAAVQTLRAQTDPATIPQLLKRLEDEDSEVREAAGEALAELGETAVPGLSAVLATGRLNAREIAVKMLAKLRLASSVDTLIAALQDESTWIRKPAAEALGLIGGDAAATALTAALEDEDEDVIRTAQTALRQIRASSPAKSATILANTP